ncbi:hypothetical protein CLOM621_08904 [Clostridium sp. M62/1]|nr:hypothetical protein CLOM621_08904 [Clostridium sp. M62/1]
MFFWRKHFEAVYTTSPERQRFDSVPSAFQRRLCAESCRQKMRGEEWKSRQSILC